MNYDKLIEILLNEFPELQQQYDEDKDYLEDLPHLTYENIFVPHIKEILEKDTDPQGINKVFELIEKMINCSNEKVQEVAVVSVLEPLVSEREIAVQLKRYMKKQSVESFDKMEKALGWIK